MLYLVKSGTEAWSTNQADGATTFGLPNSASGSNVPAEQQSIPVERSPATVRQPVATNQNTQPQAAAQPAETEMVAISRLTRTNYVGPEYPRSARRRGLTGSVDVTFTVTTEGRVRDAIVSRSNPGITFDHAAIDAVEKWRFEPTVENGVAVEKGSGVRLAFDLQ
jgi:protein TonB